MTSGRLQQLDALRGLAALGVVLFHFTSVHNPQPYCASLLFQFHHGPECVALFFMISGYVILLTAERCNGVIDFLVARASRLYPAYWVSVAFSFALVYYIGVPGTSNSRLHALVNFSMMQRLFGMPNVNGAFWSLYVELWFYIVVGLLIAARRLSLLMPLLLTMTGLYAGLKITSAASAVSFLESLTSRYSLVSQAHYFCFGVLLYQFRSRFSWKLVPVLAWLWFCDWLGGRGLAGLVNATLISGAIYGRLPWLSNPVLLFLGTISYSLYLLHQNLGIVIVRAGEQHGIKVHAAVAISLAASLAVSVAVCFLVERPANAALRMWWKSRRTKQQPAFVPRREPAAGLAN